MVTAFVSGHLDLTQEEFEKHYRPFLQYAVVMKHSIIVGDADGADKMTHQFLVNMYILGELSADNVKVYHMFDAPRNNMGFQTVGGFQTDRDRDEAMTLNSDYDIAWVRAGREKSGTAQNIKRRAKLNKKK